jgi:glucose/galactose transporter
MFFVFGFVSWINSMLIPYFKIACELTNFQSYLVTFAFYISYFVMSIPSGIFLKKVGFKRGIMYGFFFLAGGALLFVPAAYFRVYGVFLAGLFTMGTGLAILQTIANPLTTIIGPLENTVQRMSIMGVCNKGAGILSPLIFAAVVLRVTDSDLFAALPDMAEAAKNAALDELIRRVIPPYAILSVFLAIVGIVIRYSVLPDINTEEESEELIAAHGGKTNVLQFPYLVLGAVAIFLIVGVQTIAIDTIIGYANSMGLDLLEAKLFPSFTLAATIIGNVLGIIFIPKFIRQTKAVQLCIFAGLIFSLGVLLVPGATAFGSHTISVSIWFLVLLGIPYSLIESGIWPLALRDLGRFTKVGSSIMVMGFAGNGIVPLIYGWLADKIGHRDAYLVLIPCFLYLAYYALWGYKITSWSRKKS